MKRESVLYRLIMTDWGFRLLWKKGEYLGLYRTKYHWPEQPLISILIPNKDHIDDLDRCIQSIEQRSTYRNYEYIIIENNSEDQKTFQYYQELEEKYRHCPCGILERRI